MIQLVVFQKLKWGSIPFILVVVDIGCSGTVDEFFEKVEKKSEHGKKLVSWHGELVSLTSYYFGCWDMRLTSV